MRNVYKMWSENKRTSGIYAIGSWRNMTWVYTATFYKHGNELLGFVTPCIF